MNEPRAGPEDSTAGRRSLTAAVTDAERAAYSRKIGSPDARAAFAAVQMRVVLAPGFSFLADDQAALRIRTKSARHLSSAFGSERLIGITRGKE